MKISDLLYLNGLEVRRIHSADTAYTKIFNQCRNQPRHTPKQVQLDGRTFFVPDAPSFAWQVKEIFMEECYRFIPKRENPFILDIGANIGTSVYWFKKNYPSATILAFEADADVFNILKKNTEDLGVHLHHQAVWISDEMLTFHADGADGGSLIAGAGQAKPVQGIRLRKLLEELTHPVDFLKMDIEGAECSVIRDCREVLGNVDHIFIEYHSFRNEKQSLGEVLDILTSNGFRFYIEEVTKKKKPFLPDTENAPMDLQIEIYGYRN